MLVVVLFAICLAGFFTFFVFFLRCTKWSEKRNARHAVDNMINAETTWADGPAPPEKRLDGRNPNLPSGRPLNARARAPSPHGGSPQARWMPQSQPQTQQRQVHYQTQSQTQAQQYRQQYAAHLYPPGSAPTSPSSPSSDGHGFDTYSSGRYSPTSPQRPARGARKPPPRAASPLSPLAPGARGASLGHGW